MNIWRRGPLSRNPYARTAFRVTRVPRDQRQRRAVIHLIREAKNIVKADATAHAIHGVPVTEAEINSAETIIMNPATRMMEELLEHPPERLPLDLVKSLAKEVAESMQPSDGTGLPPAKRVAYAAWGRQIICHYLDRRPTQRAPRGHLETSLVPPFGMQEET